MSQLKKQFEFTDGQRELMHLIYKWYTHSNDQDFVYSGPAGTGKTSILPYVVNKLGLERDEVLYVAFTGKAASVLMQKGFDASTIHSTFYDLVESPKVRDGRLVTVNGRAVTEMKFKEKDFIDPHVKLIVVDEWSMVNEELMHAIYKHGIPVIASGDSYQLRPVFGESPFAKKVKYELTEITRQAEFSGIVQLATRIREGKELPRHYNWFNDAWILPKEYMKDRHLLEADIILTAKNKTRNMFNNRVRELHGSKGKLPNVGDKLICRKNCWYRSLDGIPLINGILGKVKYPIRMDECALHKGIYRIDFQPDYTDEYYEALACDYDFIKQPCGEKEVSEYNHGAKLEFGEALTVHLSQGSQYGSVLYYDEWVGDREYMRQLRYTAVTRAINKVWMFI